MTQIFDRGLVLALKLGALTLAAMAITAVSLWRWSTDYPHAVGDPPSQPLPFSHLHHVAEDGIDCRYCHSSVESTAFAGMPSSQVCMSCHSQLFRGAPQFELLRQSEAQGTRVRWNRVNDLPDFVYFNHGAHVTHGVACNDCHGPVEQMPLTWRGQSLEMRWCLSCHRKQTDHPWLTDCSTCHR